LARQRPALHAGLLQIAEVWDTPDRSAVLAEVWPKLEKIAVDYAVMEGAAARGPVATVPGDFGWTDVGDFHNLGDVRPAADCGDVVPATADKDAERSVRLADSHGVVAVAAGGRLMSLLGLKDVVVVDTPDALRVCARDRAQDVQRLVDDLKIRGDADVL